MSARNPTAMAVAETQDFNTATLSLYRINGVAGLLLQKGRNMLANHMPFSDQRSAELGEHISKMCAGYTTVQRRLRQVLVAYDAGSLLIVSHQDVQLVLLLTARVELDVVTSAASVFVAEHADRFVFIPAERQTNQIRDPLAPKEMVVTGSVAASNGARLRVEQGQPEISRWLDIRKALEGVLGKVMGRAQVSNLIERVCKARENPDPFQLSLEEAREVAFAVLEQIPNRSKRASLSSEIEQAFEKLKI